MRLVWRCLPVVFIGAMVVPCSARAQAKPAAAASGAEAQAARFYDAGAAAQGIGDWAAAYEQYAKAYEVFQHPQVLISLGVAEYRLGKYRAAAEHLTRFLAAPPAGLPPLERAEYARYLADAKKHVGTLRVFVEAGAEVTVNGARAGAVPAGGALEVFVEPGKPVVAARLGQREGRQEVEVQAGGSPEVHLTLAEVPAPSAPLAPAAQAAPSVGAGPATEARGTPEVKGTAAPAPAGTVSPQSSGTFVGKPATSDALRTGILVGGVTLAVTGAVVGVVSLNVASESGADARDRRETAEGPNALRERDFKNVAFWSMLGGGLAGGGALLYFLVAKPESPPRVRVGGGAGPGGGAVIVSGDF